ncbi:MAG: lipopolysaccharide heptosyltransferase II [Burkholderiales bacterium]|nr:lipopolysaccharide heptosyltransferase II [Burkholderiales bacterium]
MRARTLVVAPNWLGDCLMAQPLLTLLKARSPAAEIDVLAPPAVAPLMRRMPEVSEVLEVDWRHGNLDLRERWRLGRRLRGRYAHAFVLPNSWKSALVPFFADVPLRVGYSGESRHGLINVRHANPRKGAVRAPMARFYAQLGETPGKTPPERLPDPVLSADPVAAIAVKATFGLAPGAALVALCPGAEYGPAKRWPAEHFGALAGQLAARGAVPVVLGTQKEVPLGLAIEQFSLGRALNLAGRTSLDDAINLIAGSALVVSNDSGLMHVAAALGRPLVALFGSSSPHHTPPLAAAARVIYRALECSPCYARDCPLGHLRCLREITPAEVLQQCEALLADPAAGQPAAV